MQGGEPASMSPTGLPIHPVPVGLGTGDVESLTGYLQRLAAANGLPTGVLLALIGWIPQRSRSYVRVPRSWDLLPGPLDRVAALTGQPEPVLETLTTLPLFRAVFGTATAPTWVTIHRFFCARGALRTVTLHRRYCPGCLQEALVYRLLWQFREIDVCPRHGCLLVSACPQCQARIPLLRRGSTLGYCDGCGARFAETRAQEAPEPVVRAQATIEADSHLLLRGASLFTLPDRDVGAWEGIRLRLHFLRVTRGLTHHAVAKGTGVHRRSPLWQPTGVDTVSLGSLLRAIRFHTGSVRAFSELTPPLGWQIPTPPTVRRPCRNPWCPDYKSTMTTWTSGSVYYCRSCGCAVSLRPGPRDRLPTHRVWEALYDVYQSVEAGKSLDAALAAGGLPARHATRLVRRLIACGLAARHGRTVVLRPVPRDTLRGYPCTPPLALQLTRGRSRDRDARFAKTVRQALALHATGQPVTVAMLARQLEVDYPTLYRQVRRHGPALQQAIRSARARCHPERKM